jgi:transcriptional regulator with XRE-family HTH domain
MGSFSRHDLQMAKLKALPNSDLPKNIEALMASRGITSQPSLQKLSGVGQSTISRILRGEVTPQADNLRALADALGCDMDLLYMPHRAFMHRLEAKMPMRLPPDSHAPTGTRFDIEVLNSGVIVMGESQLNENDVQTNEIRPPADPGVVAGAGGYGRYAVRAVGDAMAPVIKDGQFLIIEEDVPVVPGDMALFRMVDERTLLRELLRETESAFHVDSIKHGVRQTLHKHDVLDKRLIAAILPASRWRPSSSN